MRIRIESDSIRFKSGMRRDRGFCPFCGFENKPLTGDAGEVIGGEQCEHLTKIRTDRCLNVHGDRILNVDLVFEGRASFDESTICLNPECGGKIKDMTDYGDEYDEPEEVFVCARCELTFFVEAR